MVRALGLLTGAVVIAIGIGLLTRADTAFGMVWAVGMVLFGVIVVVSWLAHRPRTRAPLPARDETRDGEPARFHPRRISDPMLFITGTLGAWCTVVAVVGAVEESWLWLVLAGVPAVYLAGFPLLWAAGRLRPGGVWVTPTRVVDEHYGLRTEVAIADVAALSPRAQTLHVTLKAGAAVTEHRLTPKPWRARSTALEIQTKDLQGGSQQLAQELTP